MANQYHSFMDIIQTKLENLFLTCIYWCYLYDVIFQKQLHFLTKMNYQPAQTNKKAYAISLVFFFFIFKLNWSLI